MDVPSTHAGKVAELNVSVGDKVSAGDPVLTIETSGDAEFASTVVMDPAEKEAVVASATGTVPIAASTPLSDATHSAELVVIGSGPGGYTAAFRAADLGLKVTLIERYASLGGVCLNVGCIPSKALLHAAKVVDEAAEMAEHGIDFGRPRIDSASPRSMERCGRGRLTGGIAQLAKARNVTVVRASAKFASANRLVLDNGDTLDFGKCIIAAGSQSTWLPDLPDDPRIRRFDRCIANRSVAQATACRGRRNHRSGNGVRLQLAGRRSQCR